MATIKGEGNPLNIHVNSSGEVMMNVMGRDCHDGRYAAFFVVIPWSEWEALNERAYDAREEQAQQRIC